MTASLRIKDGWTERVGFNGSAYRAAIEFTMRPYAGFDGSQQWGRVIDAGIQNKSQTEILIKQMLERVADCTIGGEPWPWTEDDLRQLRGVEFEAIAFAIHSKLSPDYMVIDDPENPGDKKRIPYPSAEEREGN